MNQQQAERDRKGRFQPGNQVCYQGWQGLVQKRFAGDEQACREWWGRMGAWHYDTVYRNIGLGAIPHPGTPEEFLQRKRSALAFKLEELPDLPF
jgi:hypothetical protein